MPTATRPKTITVISAHEGAETWVRMCRFIGATTRYEVRSFHQYDDDEYRSARSTLERFWLRIRTFVIFPVRFLLQARRLCRQCDMFIVVTSPFFMPVLAALVMKGRGTKIIALMNDIYPEALVAKGVLSRGGRLERLMKRIFDRAFRKIASAVFLSEYHKTFVAGDVRLPPQSPVIPVSAHSDPFVDHVPTATDAAIEVTYCGTLGLMHDTTTFLNWLAAHGGVPGMRFSFHTSGASKQRFESQVRQLLAQSWPDAAVVMGNSLGAVDWVRVMKNTQVGLVFQDSGSGNVIFPSKIASILAAGQAVLAVAEPDSDIGRLIQANDCGWVVAPNDVAGFDSCVRSIAQGEALLRKRLNAFRLGHGTFGTAAVAQRWIELCDSVAADGSAGR